MKKLAGSILIFGKASTTSPDLQRRFQRVAIAERTGWTLEQVDRLTVQDVNDLYGFWDAKNTKAEIDRRKATANQRSRRGRRR